MTWHCVQKQVGEYRCDAHSSKNCEVTGGNSSSPRGWVNMTMRVGGEGIEYRRDVCPPCAADLGIDALMVIDP